MYDLKSTIKQMMGEGYFDTILTRPLADWAPEFKPLLGETILPAQNRLKNKYRETAVRYRSLVANDGTRYSPAQKKGSKIVGNMDVELTDQDIAADFTSEDYDEALAVAEANNYNGSNPTMAGVIAVTGWFASQIVRPLDQKREVMRWQAIVDAVVLLRGDNGFKKDIPVSNPAGHRVSAGGQWSDNSYDPFEDIFAQMEFMANKGYTVGRIITSRQVVYKLLNNAKVKQAVGGFIAVSGDGTLVSAAGRQNLNKLNDYLQENGLPAIETYDTTYSLDSETPEDLDTTSAFYLKRNVFVMLATTERNLRIDRGDKEPLIYRGILGYHGVGRPAGAAGPGVKQDIEYISKKPPRISAEAWQTTYPVITDPEAISVIKDIS